VWHQSTFDRLVSANFEAWRISIKIAETMAASQAVIGARMTMFSNPAAMPIAELNRLVPEKALAFSKANRGATRAFSGGNPAAPTDIVAAMMSDGLVMLDWWERSIAATAAWWAPVHSQVTANVRRLR